MYAVGLTGGIGSGKTLVARVFETFGIAVFYADDAVKEIYAANAVVREQLTGLLGDDIYQDGQLQRKVMANRVFADRTLLEQVNRLVYPLLYEDFCRYAAAQSSPYVLLEAAVLFESGFDKQLQAVVAVTAPEALRIQRVTARDRVSAAAVHQRMQHQWTEERRNRQADFVLVNDGETAILPQAAAIHEKLLKIISSS